MERFTALQLKFDCQADTGIALPGLPGSAFRGALFRCLLDQFCLNPTHQDCPTCPLNNGTCPIGELAATVDPSSSRGVEVVRPFTLEPPLGLNGGVRPGGSFSFGVTLLGSGARMFPYVILAAVRSGQVGIGNRRVAPGRFEVRQVRAVNPFTGEEQVIMSAGSGTVAPPKVSIADADVQRAAAGMAEDSLTLRLLTPMRLVVDRQLVRRLTFEAFARRLFRRLTDVYSQWCGGSIDVRFSELLERAAAVEVVADRTSWLDIASHSRRTGRVTPVGGLVGDITFAGDMDALMPYVLWGTVTHVGKDVTKGDGWLKIVR